MTPWNKVCLLFSLVGRAARELSLRLQRACETTPDEHCVNCERVAFT